MARLVKNLSELLPKKSKKAKTKTLKNQEVPEITKIDGINAYLKKYSTQQIFRMLKDMKISNAYEAEVLEVRTMLNKFILNYLLKDFKKCAKIAAEINKILKGDETHEALLPLSVEHGGSFYLQSIDKNTGNTFDDWFRYFLCGYSEEELEIIRLRLLLQIKEDTLKLQWWQALAIYIEHYLKKDVEAKEAIKSLTNINGYFSESLWDGFVEENKWLYDLVI